jgi:hypothetical protein
MTLVQRRVSPKVGSMKCLPPIGSGMATSPPSRPGLPMLRAARLSACPANAVPEVKTVVDYVSPLPSTRGVADILRWVATQPTVTVS